jgi:hypothetical protein
MFWDTYHHGKSRTYCPLRASTFLIVDGNHHHIFQYMDSKITYLVKAKDKHKFALQVDIEDFALTVPRVDNMQC